ncbi:MAG: Crp/Fnr family transcriptional regulator [Crocinitomicaceae bacterium]|jgi:CRP/FNR family transcriptional regulator, polysaccharide utilization system transcription regulator|nr:Crp/Fnr family transcriptional regulator [Crocinitomicaceae bacterium]MDP4797746.1 Crp/Fnr family transcriptional regulator [Crocinitomicaceae bacterium]MDP4866096.1 Crp/Fnr family transcriptional regulator [Crocinitomicaceae bacterium]MDP5010318.1 Crp/Fnr family transcriptional regulator [Crocinitomicaceae bacterium]MDP5099259.1 Crp/Fnr family transcriptional regulator [Crocinitomicaceae bacterium]
MLDKSHKHVSCATCQARKNSLFSANFDENLSHLEEHKSCSYFKKNQPLFIEGSFPRGVYCLNQGKVKVFARGDEGKEQIIHIAKEGEIIGFRAMFSGDMYKVSATALEDANICFISKDDFLDMIDTNPTLRNGIMRELSKELGDRAIFITNMAQKSVRERLAAALIILDDVYSGEQINLTREDLANFVGTATETLIRLLKDLKEEGVIDIHTRKLEIIDKDKLMKIAGGR